VSLAGRTLRAVGWLAALLAVAGACLYGYWGKTGLLR
jgi:hypothetical protein